MAGVSKLQSFYNGKEKEQKEKNEDDRLIEGLLGENNLQGVATHDTVVASHSKGSSNIVEEEADRVAQQALSALRKSRKVTKRYEIGTPTWTGKFGQAGKIKKKVKKKSAYNQFGSSSILANIRSAQNEAKKPQFHESEISDGTKSQRLLGEMREYLSSKEDFFAPSVDIIKGVGVQLSHQEDIVQVRALLKTIATFDKEKKGWTLHNEFRHSSNNE